MTSAAVSRPVLRYHGGKWKLAPWIISHFPPHRVYVEPFGGAASVLLRKPRSYAEVYNDRWDVVVNVFRVLRDPEQAARLRETISITPFARSEFFGCAYKESGQVDAVERARRTILRSFAGFGSAAVNGEHVTGFRSNAKRSGTIPAHDWMLYPDFIPQFVERMRGVVIENRDALAVIATHDCPEALHYVDPPYPHGTRNMARGNAAYTCEMTDDDHRALAGALRKAKGAVVLSGYPCELYDQELYPDWQRVECAHLADGARPRTEVLWLNQPSQTVGLFDAAHQSKPWPPA